MRAFKLLSVLLALSTTTLIASCDLDSGDTGDPARVVLPPELPVLPSAPLAYVPHGTARVVERSRQKEGPPVEIEGTAAAVTATNRRITQRLLLLGATGNEPAYLAARSAMDRIGVPYRALIASQEAVTPSLLTDGGSSCYFSGVVVATSGLGYSDPITGAWQSALNPDEWQLLANFEVACSAREVTWYAWPSSDFGLAPGPAFDSNAAVDGQLTAGGQALFRRVKPDARIPIRNSYGYRATIADPATTVSLLEAVDGGVLVALHTGLDGREMLVSTVDSSPYLTHALLLEYDMIRWVNRDLFVGQKRAYLSAQIDDLFIDSDVWVVGQGNQGTTQLRIKGTDLSALVNWQAGRQATLPVGSTFVTTMAFNGAGTVPGEYRDATLLAVARSTSAFRWLNHTWDHENMDAMTSSAATTEVRQNCSRGAALRLTGLSCSELVTPDMSGLASLAAVRGILQAYVTNVVSDTSHTAALFPTAPGDNPSFNVGRFNSLDARLYQIPRHPTSIFYDVPTPQAETDEYNAIYRSYYGRDLSYAEVLDKDSAFGLFYLLQGDVDPLMFHQTNLAGYAGGSGTRSLYGDWVDTVVGKFLALTNVPVVTLRQSEIGAAMKARGKLDTCGVTATKVEQTSSLEIRTVGACDVPVTGLAAPQYGPVEQYAGEPLTAVKMTAGSVLSIPVTFR